MTSYSSIKTYNCIQTFFVDPDVVGKSSTCSLSSIDLYFKPKPGAGSSGTVLPGVQIAVCEVDNDEPNLSKVYSESVVSVASNLINYGFDDASVLTNFKFRNPLRIQTGKFYGIVVIFPANEYFEVWTNKQGDAIVGTNTPSPGSNAVKDGKFYQSGIFVAGASNTYRPLSDTDLKFAVRVARFTSNTATVQVFNKDYEFLKIGSKTGTFIGGELVYGVTANGTGTIAVTQGNNTIRGTSTSFDTLTVGTYITAVSNATHHQTFQIADIVSNTELEVSDLPRWANSVSNYQITPAGKVFFKNELENTMYLVDSSAANATFKFSANQQIIGDISNTTATITSVDVVAVDRFNYKAPVSLPAAAELTGTYVFAYANSTNYILDTNKAKNIDFNVTGIQDIKDYSALIVSRSLEVSNTFLSATRQKSVVFTKNLKIKRAANSTAAGIYDTPSIPATELDVFVYKNLCGNTYLTTDANTVSIDSEVAGSGLADARHITRKISFANNRFAEDVRLFITAYRPATTDVKVYAKLHNSASDSETFDEKSWTPLVYIENETQFSSSENPQDFIEYELGLPAYADAANTLPGTFTSNGTNVIAYSGSDANTYIRPNDVFRYYNPIVGDNWQVAVCTASNTTTITAGALIGSNTNVLGSGFKVDRLKYYQTAFNNIQTDNVSRYYTKSLVEVDKFDSMQIKIVFLANNPNLVPKVDTLQAIGVSA